MVYLAIEPHINPTVQKLKKGKTYTYAGICGCGLEDCKSIRVKEVEWGTYPENDFAPLEEDGSTKKLVAEIEEAKEVERLEPCTI